MNKRVLVSALALALGGCASPFAALQVNKPVPKTMPELTVVKGTTAVSMDKVKDGQWWTVMHDPQMAATIEQALKNNSDVLLAEQRLNEAGATLGIAKSNRWPAIFGQVSTNRNLPTRSGNVPVFGSKSIYDDYKVGIGTTWELDLWGRLAALKDAAQASFMQQGYNLSGVRLSVSTAVASLYTQIRIQRLQLELSEKTLTSRKAAYDLAKQRYDAGLTSEVTLRQTESEYLAVKAQLPDLRDSYTQSVNAMAVLVGGNPPPIPALKVDDLTLSEITVVPPDQPSELLLRRPDLAAAEQQLKAANANLSAVRKAFFPSIQLTGFAGRESAQWSNIFSGPARIWSFSSNITQPIFQAGQLQSQRDAVLAQRNQAVIQYEAVIRKAFSEVYNAIESQTQARERLESRAAQVQSLQRLVELAQKRVDAGVANELELLDAQRNLYAAQLAWAQAWGSQQRALLTMVSALGGGFESQPAAAKQNASNG